MGCLLCNCVGSCYRIANKKKEQNEILKSDPVVIGVVLLNIATIFSFDLSVILFLLELQPLVKLSSTQFFQHIQDFVGGKVASSRYSVCFLEH